MERFAAKHMGLTAHPREVLAETRAKLAATPTCERCRGRKPTVVRRSAASGSRALCGSCADLEHPARKPAPTPARSAPATTPTPRGEDLYRGRKVNPDVLAMLAGVPDYSPDADRRISAEAKAIVDGMPGFRRAGNTAAGGPIRVTAEVLELTTERCPLDPPRWEAVAGQP
jgi:hypothetical protein